MIELWGWPQWTYIVLMVLSLIAAMCLHGKPKTGRFDFPTSALISAGMLWLLWMGGFFA